MTRKGCPICGKAEAEGYRPFCSKRCAEVDLGHWLKGRYLIPGRDSELDQGAKPANDEPAREKD